MEYCNYNRIYPCDLSNGEGVRLTIFFSGCIHGCKGCYNVDTWEPTSGIQFNEQTIEKLLNDCAIHSGLSLSGGDPLHPNNRETVYEIVTRFKQLYPDKDIWMWTGFVFSDIKDEPEIKRILQHIDVVIDGKYEKDLPTQLPWRGSNNQRLIKIKEIV